MSIPIQKALKYADAIHASLAPFCAKIEIAGSIRRARESVGDVDVVCLAHPGQDAALRARAKAKTTVVSEGPHSLVVTMANGVQIDLWFAQPQSADLLRVTPGTWGTVLLCRTGSREHNILICERARSAGMRWDPTRGLFRGDALVASETEKEIFEALGLQWIPPALRESNVNHLQWLLTAPEQPSRPAAKGSPVAPADAARMFAKMRAVCASAGDDLQRRLAPTTPPVP